MKGVEAIENLVQQPAPQPLRERMSPIASTEELREAVLAELMGEQLELVRAQNDVATLLDATDRRLTATLQQLRTENSHLAELVGKSDVAFKGHMALRAAELARREFVLATGGALEQLLIRMDGLDRAERRHGRRHLAESVMVAAVAVAVIVGAMWLMQR